RRRTRWPPCCAGWPGVRSPPPPGVGPGGCCSTASAAGRRCAALAPTGTDGRGRRLASGQGRPTGRTASRQTAAVGDGGEARALRQARPGLEREIALEGYFIMTPAKLRRKEAAADPSPCAGRTGGGRPW